MSHILHHGPPSLKRSVFFRKWRPKKHTNKRTAFSWGRVLFVHFILALVNTSQLLILLPIILHSFFHCCSAIPTIPDSQSYAFSHFSGPSLAGLLSLTLPVPWILKCLTGRIIHKTMQTWVMTRARRAFVATSASVLKTLFRPPDIPRRLSVFVLGTTHRQLLIQISSDATVSDLIGILVAKRHMPSLQKIVHHVYFPTYGSAPLDRNLRLHDVGIRECSILHIRMRHPGGSNNSDTAPTASTSACADEPRTSTRFNKATGKFEGRDAATWTLLPDGRYHCDMCNYTTRTNKLVTQHENGQKHQQLRAAWRKGKNKEQDTHQQRAATTSLPSAHQAPPDHIGTSLRQLLQELSQKPEVSAGEFFVPQSADGFDDLDQMGWNEMPPAPEPVDAARMRQLADQLLDFMEGRNAFGDESEDDEGGELDPGQSLTMDGDLDRDQVDAIMGGLRKRYRVSEQDAEDNGYSPWPDRTTCVLDVLRHVPRATFSRRQNELIHWAMKALGLRDLPSPRVMSELDKQLQRLCGIQSIKYQGAFGNIYYVNDLAAIIAQEMANPTVRKDLTFYPEDAGASVKECWQADHWRHDMDPTLTTPMIRTPHQDFYLFEACLTKDSRVIMPHRWFTKDGNFYCKAWPLVLDHDRNGYMVDERQSIVLSSDTLLLSLPRFKEAVTSGRYHVPDPSNIISIIRTLDIDGVSHTLSFEWIKDDRTDNTGENIWRSRAKGHRVVSVPMWLYCDDTSGNVSKKWNKHHTFLFTLAGLPSKVVHQESNIQFLCTSNRSPPLEMLDGVADQLTKCQSQGIWAWDSLHREMFLLIPSVLAMLGDNPMQSEIACHVGLTGNLFCRVCKASKSTQETDAPGAGDGNGSDDESDAASMASGSSATSSRKGKKKKKMETFAQGVRRVTNFLSIGQLRSKHEMVSQLNTLFDEARRVGGKTKYKKLRTQFGIKDSFLEFFADKLFLISTRVGSSARQKEDDIASFLRTTPTEKLFSPVWRIKGLDPTRDTPVEILHTVLLGFLKYFWRDAVSRIKDNGQRKILVARIDSFNVQDLGLSPLSGHTLVQYAGSLVGRDFRVIAQIAPFVLYDLLSPELLEAWKSLSVLVPLIWEHDIEDIDIHVEKLKKAIDHFLLCTCRHTPRWFNKPKFHIILHLPEHIRRFGPPMLFATEGFEKYNAIIRLASIHSNRSSPSQDIANHLARANRTRHLLSGGYYCYRSPQKAGTTQEKQPDHEIASHWLREIGPGHHEWQTAGRLARQAITLDDFDKDHLGIGLSSQMVHFQFGYCTSRLGLPVPWSSTRGGRLGLNLGKVLPDNQLFRSADAMALYDGMVCEVGSWVIIQGWNGDSKLAQVFDIVQAHKLSVNNSGMADFLVLRPAMCRGVHRFYAMPQFDLLPTTSLYVLPLKTQNFTICCTVNMQHDCYSNKCHATGAVTVRQEREATTLTKAAISHKCIEKQILNLAQMRMQKYISPFRPAPIELNRNNIIFHGVKNEVDLRKVSDKATEAGVEPGRKRKAGQEPLSRIAVSSHGNRMPSNLAKKSWLTRLGGGVAANGNLSATDKKTAHHLFPTPFPSLCMDPSISFSATVADSLAIQFGLDNNAAKELQVIVQQCEKLQSAPLADILAYQTAKLLYLGGQVQKLLEMGVSTDERTTRIENAVEALSSAKLSKAHKNAAHKACKAILFAKPWRIDWENAPLRSEAMNYLESRKDMNGMKKIFEHEDDELKKELLSYIGSTLSQLKAQAKQGLCAVADPKRNKPANSLTETVRQMADKWLGGRDKMELWFVLYIAILRAIGRHFPNLILPKNTIIPKPTELSTILNPPTVASVDPRPDKSTPPSTPDDAFWFYVADFMALRLKAWGSVSDGTEWRPVLIEIFDKEWEVFPQDELTRRFKSGLLLDNLTPSHAPTSRPPSSNGDAPTAGLILPSMLKPSLNTQPPAPSNPEIMYSNTDRYLFPDNPPPRILTTPINYGSPSPPTGSPSPILNSQLAYEGQNGTSPITPSALGKRGYDEGSQYTGWRSPSFGSASDPFPDNRPRPRMRARGARPQGHKEGDPFDLSQSGNHSGTPPPLQQGLSYHQPQARPPSLSFAGPQAASYSAAYGTSSGWLDQRE